jgi:hypothetical protein
MDFSLEVGSHSKPLASPRYHKWRRLVSEWVWHIAWLLFRARPVIRLRSLFNASIISALVGEPIAGAILSRDHGSYTGLIVFTGVSLLLGSVVTLFVKLRINSSLLAKV